jgi:hypothetical protein
MMMMMMNRYGTYQQAPQATMLNNEVVRFWFSSQGKRAGTYC